jgi:small subunit ribosomal protein S7
MRRRSAGKREAGPDLKFKSKLVNKFISIVMERGKRSTAENIVYDAFDLIAERSGQKDALAVFQKAIDNVRPLVELKSRRVGGATYQVPIEVKTERGTALALHWIRNYAKSRKGRSMVDRIADEVVDAYKNTGAAIKKREDTHKMAEANKAFAHFRW